MYILFTILFSHLQINLCKKMEPARQRLLFDLFIPHFIEMSQYALQSEGAIAVAQIAIRQAERLARILYEQDDKGQKYLDQIEPVKRGIDLLVRQMKQNGPGKPRRGSLTRQLSTVTRPRTLGSRNSSMIEDPYVNLTKVTNETIIVEETHDDDDDAKSTLKASRGPKQRSQMVTHVTAEIHTGTTDTNEHLTAEDIVENARKRNGLTKTTIASEEVRIRS